MGGELVLVIDDSPTITKVVQLVLTKAGYQIQTAPDGELGLQAVRAQRPDLILLDFVTTRTVRMRAVPRWGICAGRSRTSFRRGWRRCSRSRSRRTTSTRR